MGLQPRPGGNANVQMVREFHATPAICMRHAAPLGSLRAARRGERDANAEEATGEKQLLRLERPEASLWQPIQKDSSSAFDGPTAFRRDTFPLMAARPPL